MTRCALIAGLLFFSVLAGAQKQFPEKLPVNVDSLLNLAGEAATPPERAAALVRSIDSSLAGYADRFPLYRGMLYMYQGFYIPFEKDRAAYQQRAVELLSRPSKLLADSFSAQAYQLLGYYHAAGRLSEWLPVDRIIRESLKEEAGDSARVIALFALSKVSGNAWSIARDWGAYHLKMQPVAKDAGFESRFVQVAAKWAKLKGRFGLWKETPYYQRNEGESFRPAFEELRRNLRDLRPDMVERNVYGSSSFNRNYRVLYYMMQWHLVMDLGNWAINDHREGVAILPLKLFLLQDVLPDELDAAAKAGVKPVLAEWQLRDAYLMLSRLYINIGNGAEAWNAASEGIEKLLHYPGFTEKEQLDAYYSLYYLLPEAARTQGRYESALKTLATLKEYYPQPSSVNPASVPYWNLFIDIRLQEAFILKELNRNNDAIDSLDQLMAKLAPISSDSSELLYELYQWPHLQYAVMDISGKSLNADNMRSWLLEALTIVEQKNNWMNVDYYYPMQRLYLIAHYRSTGSLLKHVLYNLLFYTERNLRYSFAALAPEDRIRLYERKLSSFFDLYHELLFTGVLDTEPALKEKIIHQSLYLKNALADGNMIGTELFQTDDEMKKLVEDIRRERSQTMLISTHYEMLGGEKDFSDLRGSSQSLWLSVLDYVNTDSLYESQGHQKISAGLNPGQVYVETTRYTAWLSDSTARYAAYVISSTDKLRLVPLFREDSLIRILKDRSASPQSGLLNTAGTRGITIKGAADSASTKFRKGDIDRLGAYVLAPLWKYLQGKKELLIVPDGLLNRVSIAALQWNRRNLFEYLLIRQVSGSNALSAKAVELTKDSKALLAGSLRYESDLHRSGLSPLNKAVQWNYLPGTATELGLLLPIFRNADINTATVTGYEFPDSARKRLSGYNIIHLATHGFYFDSSVVNTLYSHSYNLAAIRENPMMRCGIAMSYANTPPGKNFESDGYLFGFELANTDLRNCYLVSLSACETGLGDLRNNLGVDGLSRALKLGGARHLLISLWKVPDHPTAVFMQHFYQQLFSGSTPAAALQSTQKMMSVDYPVSDWAAFIVVE